MWGIEAGYEFEDPDVSGFEIRARGSSFGRIFSSAHVFARMNHTFDFTDSWLLRAGSEFGTGSESMPVQYRWSVSQPTGEEMWRNQSYWSAANIDSELNEEIQLVANRNNGLIGYAVPGIGSPDVSGNNILTFTLWSDWSPFSNRYLRPATFELFAGAGRSWHGNFIENMPGFAGSRKNILASSGAGFRYKLADLPFLSDWRPQSRFIDGLELSIRFPFYVREAIIEDEWDTHFVIGISESF